MKVYPRRTNSIVISRSRTVLPVIPPLTLWMALVWNTVTQEVKTLPPVRYLSYLVILAMAILYRMSKVGVWGSV